MTKKVKCLYGEKGLVRYIPEKYANDYNYMQRHGLHKVEVPELPPIKNDKPVNLDLKSSEFEPEILEKEYTKDELFELLDKKGVEYKKTFGIDKLKQLLNS